MFKSWRDRYSVCATWLLGIVALFPVSAFAQLQLFEFDGTTETPVTSLLQVPPVASGDTVIIRFRLFNNGLGAATFSNLGLSGQDFLITSAPSIPYVIAPGSFAEFRVTFSPDAIGSYSANMLVNTIAVALRKPKPVCRLAQLRSRAAPQSISAKFPLAPPPARRSLYRIPTALPSLSRRSPSPERASKVPLGSLPR